MLIFLSVLVYIYTIIYSYIYAPFLVVDLVYCLFSIVIFCLIFIMKKKPIFIFAFTCLLLYMSSKNVSFSFLLILPLLLCDVRRDQFTLLLICSGTYLLGMLDKIPVYVLALGLGCTFNLMRQKEDDFNLIYDKERQQRYDLEHTQHQLIKANENIVNITELNERNRIARAIHDNLGHKLVGINMLLQASDAVKTTDGEKSNELLKRSIRELTDAVDLLRDTVHDLKPNKEVGIQTIEKVIEEYNYCEVTFKTKGNLNSIPSGYNAILTQNVREALTNTSKYSNANHICIDLDVHTKYIRLRIKDNGDGHTDIIEGLGLSGMRERVYNVGGNFTINANDGFELVTFLPIKRSAH